MNMDWDLVITALGAMLYKSPLYLTWLVGIAIIMVYSKQHGKNTTFLLFVVVCLFIVDVIGMVFNTGFNIHMRRTEMSIQTISYIIGGVNLVLIILESVLWGLLFYLFLAKTRPKTASEN